MHIKTHWMNCSYCVKVNLFSFLKKFPHIHPHASPASSHSVSLSPGALVCRNSHIHTFTHCIHTLLLPLTFSPGQMQSLLPLSATFEVSYSQCLVIQCWNMSAESPLASRIHGVGAGRVRISVWGSCLLLTFEAQHKVSAISHCCSDIVWDSESSWGQRP